MSVWQAAYGSVEPQITVNYNPDGSGAGITQFNNQVVDFGESDAPMTAAQYAALPSGTTAINNPNIRQRSRTRIQLETSLTVQFVRMASISQAQFLQIFS